jgi:hypothetical protein
MPSNLRLSSLIPDGLIIDESAEPEGLITVGQTVQMRASRIVPRQTWQRPFQGEERCGDSQACRHYGGRNASREISSHNRAAKTASTLDSIGENRSGGSSVAVGGFQMWIRTSCGLLRPGSRTPTRFCSVEGPARFLPAIGRALLTRTM